MNLDPIQGAAVTKPLIPVARDPCAQLARPGARFLLFALVLGLCFWQPLYGLVRLAVHSSLYSHILLIPFITFYLLWLQRRDTERKDEFHDSDSSPPPNRLTPFGARTLPGTGLDCRPGPPTGRSHAPTLPRSPLPAPRLAALAFLLGSASLAAYWIMVSQGWRPEPADYLCLAMLSFLLLLLAGAFIFFGRETLKARAFPLAMLLFMVPFPTFVKNGIEIFFQHTSAYAASSLFQLSGTPFFREGLIFHLPGISIRVAEECSGIRSSFMLFITALLAGHLFLRAPWKRAVLALVVIPLGIVRNGFRIFTIGMLCVHVDPSMIDSPIHHRGGPIFFLLSLIPFFLMLVLLRKSEGKRQPA